MLAFRPLLRIAALLACSSMPLLAQGVRVKLPAWPDPVLLDSMRTEHEIAGAPEAVYGALQKAFADLDIPKGNTDGKAGIIASERFERMRVLGQLRRIGHRPQRRRISPEHRHRGLGQNRAERQHRARPRRRGQRVRHHRRLQEPA